MHTLHIYLNFPGNCETAFEFYKSVFGGEFDYVGRFTEVPPMEGAPPMPVEHKNKIMHITLPINNIRLMGSDIIPGFGPDIIFGNNFAVSIDAKSKTEADRFFNALSEGGKITMPLQDTFWNAYFGMCTDKFGINWMMNCDAV